MKIATDRQTETVTVIEDAQTDIRELMKKAYLLNYSRDLIERELKAIIIRAGKNIKIKRLRGDLVKSLTNFANNQWRAWKSSGISPELLLFLRNNKGYPSEKLSNEIEKITGKKPKTVAMGVPLQRFYQEVWKEKVKPTLDELSEQRALDPNDYSGRNSLRNLAEMEVRYQAHKDDLEELRKDGVKIVACSSHADCSKRCAQYQGRLYSLDGTSGTIDGERYVPIEEATENPDDRYTTKAGRVYQNGLMGFNCRHRLTPYKGQKLPTISAEERKKEYKITQKQREMEREVRRAKTNAIMAKELNRTEYLKERKRAIELNKIYKKFSEENGRAYYPMRVHI